jgi:glycosyltransferase involved in cell wall biosynthesis
LISTAKIEVAVPRRLLMLAPHLEIGGSDKFNLDLIECLQRDHAYEVSIITTRSSPHRWRKQFERLTRDVFILHTFLAVEDYPQFISNFIQTRTPDTVLIANSRIGYQLLPFLRTANGPSFVDHLHMEDWGEQGYPRLSLNYASYLDCTIVSSEYLKKRLTEEGGDPNRIQVATTNIDPRLWDRSGYDQPSIRAKYGVPEGVPVIAFVGRLCRQKQPDVMANVIKKIRDGGLEFVCLVAGGGDYRLWLEKFIRKHHLDEIKLLGAVPSDQVREILAISDVYFMPSESEGIALTLFEAMSMGVPPVSANVGGQAELVATDCGILIEPGPSQVVEYADALERLLTDRELRRSMAAQSRERIRDRFTLAEMGNRMAELLECAARNSTFDPKADRQNVASATESHGRLRGFVTTTLLLLSPKDIRLKLKNLSLLGRIFLDPKKRLQLAEAFDARYYLSHNPDLKARGVAPLIHYVVQGYLEERLPSPHFDAPSRDGVNPMLWRINQRD